MKAGWADRPGGPAESSTLQRGASTGRSSPVRRPRRLLSGAGNLREGGSGDRPHRTQTLKEQEKRTLVVPPCHQPLAPRQHCSRTRKALRSAISSPSPVVCEGRLPGPQPWPATVMSLPLFPGPFWGGFSRTTYHPTLSSDPNLGLTPPPPVFVFLSCLLTSSDHLNHFGDLIMYIDKCKL